MEKLLWKLPDDKSNIEFLNGLFIKFLECVAQEAIHQHKARAIYVPWHMPRQVGCCKMHTSVYIVMDCVD